MLAVDICWTYADICCCLEDGGATTKSRPQSSYLTIFETYKDVVREKKWTHARYYLLKARYSLEVGVARPCSSCPPSDSRIQLVFFFHAFTFDDTFKTRLRFSRADSKVCCSLLEIFTFFSHHHGIPSQVGSNNTSLLFRLIQFHGKN